MADAWNPGQYQKFEADRNLPFYDLLHVVIPRRQMNIVDLGCGTGKLTRVLHDSLQAKSTLGIDSSPAMLQESISFVAPTLRFEEREISSFEPKEKYDLIFSNAALHWVPDHVAVIKRLPKYLEKNGQIAIQMPTNFDFPSHMIARELAAEMPFKQYIDQEHFPSVMGIDAYSELFYRLGARKQNVTARVYPHVLESTDSLVEWVKGSLLTYYQNLLPPEEFTHFLTEYSRRVILFFGEQKPFFMPFKRILIWAQF